MSLYARTDDPGERRRGGRGAWNEEPGLIIPALGGFYSVVSQVAYPLIRITPAAILFLMHGWGKLMGGPAPVIAGMAKYGMYPPTLMGYIVIVLETLGAVCVAVGLFTRFFAAALAIEMAVLALYVHAPWGLAPVSSTYQLVLTWGLVFFAIALRGGGPYSLDRKIGWEH
jgi:putative oxidoreductase